MLGKLLNYPSGDPSGDQVDAFLGGLSAYHCAGAVAGLCVVQSLSGTGGNAVQGGLMTPAVMGGFSLSGRMCHSKPELPPQPQPEPSPMPTTPSDVIPCTPGFCANQPNDALPPGGYRTTT
jgi:hypothetical protein